jgi:hypothetical protein
VKAKDCFGHIFFYLAETDIETKSDFQYYFDNVIATLEKKNISYSLHSELPIESKTCFSANVKPNVDKLHLELGYIFQDLSSNQKVINGVLTDIDLLSLSTEYFKE